MHYPFETILINQREITIQDITSGNARPLTEFEASTFNFIRSWLGDQETFSIQTSGSTGEPKSIPVTREQMKRSAQRTIQTLGLTENLTALICLNTRYIAGRMMMVRAFEGKMKIIATEPSHNPFKNLGNRQPDFMAVVPLQLQTLLSSSANIQVLNNMKAILVGGAAVSEYLKTMIQAIACPVHSTYGMTETITHIALQLLNTPQQTNVFKTLAGVRISADQRGCLAIDDEILTEQIITNDLINLVSTDEFQWLGRIDNIINTGGIKVSPEKIEQDVEQVLSDLKVLRKFFIAGFPHQTLGQQVVLSIEGSPLKREVESQIQEKLKQHLSPYEVPKKIMYIHEFNFTSTGKINRGKSLENN